MQHRHATAAARANRITPREQVCALLMAVVALAGAGCAAHAAGLALPAMLVLLVPAAAVLSQARVSADLVGQVRQQGVLVTTIASAIRGVAEAGARLLAGAAALANADADPRAAEMTVKPLAEPASVTTLSDELSATTRDHVGACHIAITPRLHHAGRAAAADNAAAHID